MASAESRESADDKGTIRRSRPEAASESLAKGNEANPRIPGPKGRCSSAQGDALGVRSETVRGL